jgi:spermidine/putrescine transport system permease protein
MNPAETASALPAPDARLTWLDRVRGRPWARTALAAALPVGWVTVLLFVPYLMLLIYSLRTRTPAGDIVPCRGLDCAWTLANYHRLFTTSVYPSTILSSAQIAAIVTALSLLLAFPLAYLLAFKVKRHKNLMYMAVIIPLWVSYLVRAYAWKIILGQEGILNGLLIQVGVIHEPLEFLLYSKWAVIIALTHIYTPFTLMPIYAVLESIPPSLKEASQDLYAGRFATFFHVILPLSLPGVLAGSTFAFVLSMGDFVAPQLLGGPDSALMISNVVVSLLGVAYNWPLGAAMSMVVLTLVVLILTLANRLERRFDYRGESGRAAKTDALGAIATESRA